MVFRDVSTSSTLAALARGARGAAAALVADPRSSDARIEALLAACDYEGALADAGDGGEDLERAARLSDEVARALAWAELGRPWESTALVRRLGEGAAPAAGDRACERKRAEGFAYYALRPANVLRAVRRWDTGGAVTVIGIRTIGTALSALAMAGLAGVAPARDLARMTVRPVGPPYDRRVTPASPLDRLVERAVRARIARRGWFVVIDEGPGLSGSTFLAVAEWIERLGAPTDRIVLFGDHEPDATALCAPDAARRWARYHAAAFARPPIGDGEEDLAGGRWREVLGLDEATWPAWSPLTDREKILRWRGGPRRRGAPLPAGALQISRFEGLGRFGRAAARRQASLAAAGLGAPLVSIDEGEGTLTTAVVPGRRPEPGSFPRFAARIGAYCAWRSADPAFADPAGATERAQSGLVDATMINAERELGAAPRACLLPVVRPVIADGRMQPEEWLAGAEDRLIKTDATSHGDDHLLPGPTDIAWDLAGVVVEWALDEGERSHFLAAYAALSGDRAVERVAAYEVAYAAFRAAAWGMTPPSADAGEARRRARARERARELGRRALARLG